MSLLSKEKIIEFQKHTGFEYLIKTRRACNESQRRTDSEQLPERKSIVRVLTTQSALVLAQPLTRNTVIRKSESIRAAKYWSSDIT